MGGLAQNVQKTPPGKNVPKSQGQIFQECQGQISQGQIFQECQGQISQGQIFQECQGQISQGQIFQECQGQISQGQIFQECQGQISQGQRSNGKIKMRIKWENGKKKYKILKNLWKIIFENFVI